MLLLAATWAAAAQIPEGTQIQIRLTTAINTSTAKQNQPFDAVVIAPVVVGERLALGAGTKVSGHIKEVKAATQPDDQATLDLAFDRMSDSDGKKANIAAKLASIDNARESVSAAGKITGIIASQTGVGRLDQGIKKVEQKYPSFGDLLGTIKEAVLKEPDANIDYEPGVEMTIELTKALEWTGKAHWPTVQPIEPQAQLAQLVNDEPFRTRAEKPPRPSDITSLMLLGSQQQIENAFQKAGWMAAAQLDSKSKLETFRALAEDRGYQEAPVSVLLLDGRPPDLTFEKLNDTFAARHHLRIWRRPGSFNGQQIWVCSATHDTGIDFSEQDRTFIHKIDPHIDGERAKVVNDLLFTGLVKGLSLVDRQRMPEKMSNATGDLLETDGKMAVLSF
jgi:LssY C-terminus